MVTFDVKVIGLGKTRYAFHFTGNGAVLGARSFEVWNQVFIGVHSSCY